MYECLDIRILASADRVKRPRKARSPALGLGNKEEQRTGFGGPSATRELRASETPTLVGARRPSCSERCASMGRLTAQRRTLHPVFPTPSRYEQALACPFPLIRYRAPGCGRGPTPGGPWP